MVDSIYVGVDDTGMTTTTFLRCNTHKRNLPFEYGKVCDTFVRSHYHVAGECQKWNGLTAGQHQRDKGLRCECGKELVKFAVAGRETETECGDKCQSATGPACECRCKGEMHGVAA
jgi:hypothetical protein